MVPEIVMVPEIARWLRTEVPAAVVVRAPLAILVATVVQAAVAAVPAVIGLEINRSQGQTVREAVEPSAAPGQVVAAQLAPAALGVLPVLAAAPAVVVGVPVALVAVVDAGEHFNNRETHRYPDLKEINDINNADKYRLEITTGSPGACDFVRSGPPLIRHAGIETDAICERLRYTKRSRPNIGSGDAK